MVSYLDTSILDKGMVYPGLDPPSSLAVLVDPGQVKGTLKGCEWV